jgi:predicted SAM-dependent methyltransferase
MAKKLNLGCGKEIKEGYINMDMVDFGQDIVRNAENGLPFDSESIDEILAKHFLEHIFKIKFVLDECYRVLKKGGIFIIEVPHKDCVGAYDFRHIRYFTEETFKRIAEDFDYEIEEISTNHKPYITAKLIK